MRTKLRFSIHFIIGLVAWMVGLGFIMLLAMEWIFPLIGLTEDHRHYDLYVLMVFILNIALCSILFSWYFGGPIAFMMTWIADLSNGKLEPPGVMSQVYNKNDKLKHRFRLYGDLIGNIYTLSSSLKEAKQEREKLEEAKKDWVAGISHDIKTPLTYVTGYSALLLNEDYVWSEEEKTTFLKEIQMKGQHMETLIEDINLSFQMNNDQSTPPIQLRPVNMIEFLQRLIADVANDPRASSYGLSFDTAEQSMELLVDEKLMYRVLQNLLLNAIIHNEAGTSIHVTLKKESQQFAEIKISDDGAGMDQDTLNNLFQKYYRSKTATASKSGTGLGMSIVKSLILAHGGFLTIDSELSRGTVICIQLPIRLQMKSIS